MDRRQIVTCSPKGGFLWHGMTRLSWRSVRRRGRPRGAVWALHRLPSRLGASAWHLGQLWAARVVLGGAMRAALAAPSLRLHSIQPPNPDAHGRSPVPNGFGGVS